MSITNPEETPSAVEVLVGSYQGRMLLMMGTVYTLIIGVSIAAFYVLTGWVVTSGVIGVYAVLTSMFAYFRAPMRKLVLPAFLVFTVTPVSVGTIFILLLRVIF